MPANETAMNAPINTPTKFTSKTFLRMLIGAVLGGGVGYACMTLAVKIGVPSKQLTWSDFLAIWMGIVFVAMGIFFGYLATNRKQLAKALEPPCPDAEDASGQNMLATNQEVRTAQLQAGVLALAGMLMLAPILALGPMRNHPSVAIVVYACIFLLFAVQTFLNFRIWRTSDEFMQRALLVVCAVTFAAGQGLLFLWAAAERLHLVPAISSWDVYALLMACYLLTNAYVSIRLRR